MRFDLVKSDVAARCGNTSRPLTHHFDQSEGGLAVDATQETWKPVVGYEGYYEVSDLGRVRSLDRTIYYRDGRVQRHKGKLLKGSMNNLPQRHLSVNLTRRARQTTKYVHSLVMEAFIGPRPEGMEVCHNNGVAEDNRLKNLRYGTKSENAYDKVRHGTHPGPKKTHCPYGHPLVEGNIYWVGKYGTSRRCRVCAIANAARHKRMRKAANQ